MIPQTLSIPGLKVFQLKIFRDDRGFFVERFKSEWGLPNFIQDNHSCSKPGVVRGLHYQYGQMAQGKLVGCMRGRIWDVVVDLRPSSPSFGQWNGIELSAENGKLLWIPPGFAHGFCVLGNEDADMMYKVDAPYSAAHEGGIRFDDPTLKILWPMEQMKTSLIVSEKDRVLPSFEDYRKKPLF